MSVKTGGQKMVPGSLQAGRFFSKSLNKDSHEVFYRPVTVFLDMIYAERADGHDDVCTSHIDGLPT